MFLQEDQNKKLWQKIGIDRNQNPPFHQEIELIQSEIDSRKISLDESIKESIIQQRLRIDLLVSHNQPDNQQPLDHNTQKFQNLMDKLNLQVRQIEESEQIIVSQEGQDSSQRYEEQLDEFYNYDLSRAQGSVTPLVYSKNSRKTEEVKFRKENARMVLLKLSISEFKESLKMLKQQLQQLFQELSSQQQNLREEICYKYYDLQRQYSMKIQQSIFNHKQEYQQLRYQYEQLKTKEQKENNKAASTAELIPSERDISLIQRQLQVNEKNQQLNRENAVLRQKVSGLQLEKDKLVKEANDFKRKIDEIEAFTMQIKQSNDKLYEYVFDLEQQLAFHREEIPHIKKEITQELTQQHRKQIDLIEKQNNGLQLKKETLEQQLNNLTGQNIKLQQAFAMSERQLEKLRKANDNYKTEEAQILKLNEQRIADLLSQLREKEEEILQNHKLIEEKDIMLAEYLETINRSKLADRATNSWQHQEARNKQKNQQSRIDKQGTELREDRKQLQAVQMDRLLLQRQNTQLKTVIQLYNKMGNNLPQPVQMPVPINRTAQNLTNYYVQRQTMPSQTTIPQSNLSIKQRELLKYQGYLQSEAHRLEIKQKQIDIEMTLRKTLQQKQREHYHLPERIYEITANQDDYGMKNVATHAPRTIGQRRNNFCSSEAQAIIQRVKMRQNKKNQQGCYLCKDPRTCRCDVLSRGSRGSRQSTSRQYIKMQHYRPKNYSPGIHTDEYYRKDQKSSKMKLIEDKVKRLKSQLKNSLSNIKD